MQGMTPEINDINITVSGVEKLLSKPNLFPFLNTGQMFAVFHMAGIVPDSYDILNMTVIIGAMNGASSFKTLGVTCILSGPAALVGFSLLRSFSTPGKLMEHIITSHIMKHADTYNILYPLQHGFRKGLSCETQLIEFVDDITRNIDAGKQTECLVMDFSNAFVKVSHVSACFIIWLVMMCSISLHVIHVSEIGL
jgi:hypothetical protein